VSPNRIARYFFSNVELGIVEMAHGLVELIFVCSSAFCVNFLFLFFFYFVSNVEFLIHHLTTVQTYVFHIAVDAGAFAEQLGS